MNSVFFDFEKICPLLLLLLAIFCYNPQITYAQPTGFSDELVIDGWSQVVGMTYDKNGRMYVWEKGGKVWVVENGVKIGEPLIDISEEVGNWRDFGLIGFALDPNFLNNGHIYLWYVVDRHHLLNFGTSNYNPNASSEKEATIARLTRYTANSTNNFTKVNYSSRKILIGESKSSGPPILHESHGAGHLVFGTDGTLMVSVGDGASYTNPVDEGSHPATYYQQALNDGIITPEQNIGAYRCQSLNNLSGKILRIDPNTGDGVPSNPYYQAINPRSSQSRIWSIGIRNPYRIAIKPESGSHNAQDGNPGTIFFGDVGWSTWEDLNIANTPGQNFGWPIYEGISQKAGYNNPNYAVTDAEHERPKVDWRHGADQARAYVNRQMVNIGSGSVSGKQFRGNSSTGGIWYDKTDFPEEYQNTYFHADYSGGWIRNFGFDQQFNPTFVKDFKLNAGAVVFLNTSPIDNGLFYVRYPNQIRRIVYTGNTNKKPIAVLEADKTYGASPLTVKFDASKSFDPEYSPLTYSWDFGDNATSSEVSPSTVFETSSSAPATYPVKLTVTDAQGAKTEQTIPISLNNTPPIIISTSIDNHNSFNARNGTTLNLNAVVTDREHNGQLKFEWQTALFHDGHNHAEPIDNNPSTTTSFSPIECDGSTYWFRITLKITDPEGLFTTFQKDIFPACQGLQQTINCAPIPDQSLTAGDIVLNATATSGLPVSTYLLEGPAVVFGNKIVPTGLPGKVVIRATQGGNEVYQPATPIERSFNIVLPTNASCTAEGQITRDIWYNGGRNSLNDIPINTTPNATSTLNRFEVSPFSSADNAQRVRGFICPPQTGLYTFWIASDEDSQLWLSTNANPKNRRLIANVKGSTRSNQWNKYATQQSEPILLVAGSQYYIESIMNGGGHLSAGWKMPDNALDRPISGQYLSTFKDKQDQVITFFGIPDKLTTEPAFTIGATASSGLPVNFAVVSGSATVSGTTVTLTGQEGIVVIRASQNGNDQYNAAQAVERRFEIVAPPTVPKVVINTPINGSSFIENTIDIRYTLSGNLAFHNANHLLLSLDNQPAIDVHTLNGIYRLNNLSEGVHTVKIQLADGNHRPFSNSEATSIVSFTIIPSEKVRQNQLISFPSIANKLTTDVPFTISASSSSNLPITFSIVSGPATINGNRITLNGSAGTVNVRASQNGNSEYLAAPSVDRPFTVSAPTIEKQIQTITFNAIPDKLTTDAAFTVSASASSNLPLQLKIIAGPATVNGNSVTLNGTSGTVVLTASQSGNRQYFPAQNISRSFKVSELSINTNDNEPPKDYCNLSSNFPWQEWIGQVVFNTLNNSSSKDIYKFYEQPSTTVKKGESYQLKVVPAFSWTQWDEYVKVWIDFNHDGDFEEAGENIITAISKGGAPYQLVEGISADILIPSNAVNGKTRMRIAMQRAKYPVVCGTVAQGEVEDYIIEISGGNSSEPEIEKQNQGIDFPPIPDQLATAGSFSLYAAATSGLPVTFSILSGPASINGPTLTLFGSSGTVVINAKQEGNQQYHAAQSMNRAFKVIESTDTGGENDGEDTNTAPSNYCDAKGNSPWQEWIENVAFGTINNTSSKDGHGDFTNLSTSLTKGNSYSISVRPGFSWTQWNEHINVWIDFDRNGSFEDIGEQVLSGISVAGNAQSFPQAVTGTVTIPSTSKTGKTRMRVAMQQSKYADDCGNFEFGEVEDYSINIVAGSSNRIAQILTFSTYADKSQAVALEWISNGDYLAANYQIERSADNLHFYSIKEMQSEGTEKTHNFYFTSDAAPLKGSSYYRIKQINKNGSFKYSNAVEIERAFGIEEFYLYPNPVKDIIHVNLKAFLGKTAHVLIYNSYGQLVKESKLSKIQSPTLSFSMNQEQNGIYYLKIKPKGRKAIGQKFILSRNY